jgi:hypothetical protein
MFVNSVKSVKHDQCCDSGLHKTSFTCSRFGQPHAVSRMQPRHCEKRLVSKGKVCRAQKQRAHINHRFHSESVPDVPRCASAAIYQSIIYSIFSCLFSSISHAPTSWIVLSNAGRLFRASTGGTPSRLPYLSSNPSHFDTNQSYCHGRISPRTILCLRSSNFKSKWPPRQPKVTLQGPVLRQPL